MAENFGIKPRVRKTDVIVGEYLGMPIINSNKLSDAKGTLGSIAFDTVTARTWEYYKTGAPPNWRPIGSGSSAGETFDFSLKKSGAQVIPSATETIITSFSTTAPYFDNTSGGWNVGTGVYTADAVPHSFLITAKMTWMGGTSNQGLRNIRIYYKPSLGPEVLVGPGSTQANPNLNDPTPQEVFAGVSMSPGDQVYVKAYHTAPVALTLADTGVYVGHRTNNP